MLRPSTSLRNRPKFADPSNPNPGTPAIVSPSVAKKVFAKNIPNGISMFSVMKILCLNMLLRLSQRRNRRWKILLAPGITKGRLRFLNLRKVLARAASQTLTPGWLMHTAIMENLMRPAKSTTKCERKKISILYNYTRI